MSVRRSTQPLRGWLTMKEFAFVRPADALKRLDPDGNDAGTAEAEHARRIGRDVDDTAARCVTRRWVPKGSER